MGGEVVSDTDELQSALLALFGSGSTVDALERIALHPVLLTLRAVQTLDMMVGRATSEARRERLAYARRLVAAAQELVARSRRST